jgi:hypothetical protein
MHGGVRHAHGRPTSLVQAEHVGGPRAAFDSISMDDGWWFVRSVSLSNQIKSSPYAINYLSSHALIVPCRASLKFKSSHDLRAVLGKLLIKANFHSFRNRSKTKQKRKKKLY